MLGEMKQALGCSPICVLPLLYANGIKFKQRQEMRFTLSYRGDLQYQGVGETGSIEVYGDV